MDAKTGDPLHGSPMEEGAALRTLLGRTNRDWWPNQLSLEILPHQGASGDPYGDDFDYAEAFLKLDYDAVKKDLTALMTDSQPWWPADYGHYGPFFIRMAWHAAGTYRIGDGRGGASSGQQRFAPLNSWPDNANLDKARRLLWPIKQKYGRNLSWADLLILAGNVAIESMGGPIFGFGGGRRDVYEPEHDTYWGTEENWVGKGAAPRMGDDAGKAMENPLAAVQMGLIYVNPEGPGGNPDPLGIGARDPRDLRADGDERRGDARAHRRRSHLRQVPRRGDASKVGAEPEGADIAQQGLGWQSGHGCGFADDTITSGLEGPWTPTPIKWSMNYLHMLLDYEYELVDQPGGRQAVAAGQPEGRGHGTGRAYAGQEGPDDDDDRRHGVPRGSRVPEDRRAVPERSGRVRRCLCPCLVQANPSRHGSQGALPRAGSARRGPDLAGSGRGGDAVSDSAIADFKQKMLGSDLSVSALVKAAWASASTYRKSDHRGGANGARIRFAADGLEGQRSRGAEGDLLDKLDFLRGESSLADADRAGRQSRRSRRRRRMPATT